MKKQQWAKATAVVLAASLLLPSVIPADTQAKAKIRLSAKKISLKVGQTKKLKVKGTKKKVVWKSSKKKIASVSKKGVVKALRRGKAKITAKTAGKKLVCMVTVKNSKIKPTVIPATSAPGDSLASCNGICTICFPVCDSGSYDDNGSGGNAFCFHGTL